MPMLPDSILLPPSVLEPHYKQERFRSMKLFHKLLVSVENERLANIAAANTALVNTK
jgi:hypothetical protein